MVECSMLWISEIEKGLGHLGKNINNFYKQWSVSTSSQWKIVLIFFSPLQFDWQSDGRIMSFLFLALSLLIRFCSLARIPHTWLHWSGWFADQNTALPMYPKSYILHSLAKLPRLNTKLNISLFSVGCNYPPLKLT